MIFRRVINNNLEYNIILQIIGNKIPLPVRIGDFISSIKYEYPIIVRNRETQNFELIPIINNLTNIKVADMAIKFYQEYLESYPKCYHVSISNVWVHDDIYYFYPFEDNILLDLMTLKQRFDYGGLMVHNIKSSDVMQEIIKRRDGIKY